MDKEAIREELLAELRAKREELVGVIQLMTGALIAHSHIVVSDDGLALSYVMDGKNVKSVHVAGGSHKASRFEKIDAEKLAASTIDGHNKPAKAVHVTIAIREEIGRVDAVMAMIVAADKQ